jgi:glycerol uptake facilitator-like aquaporin
VSGTPFSLSRRLAAEAAGTLLLVTAVVGSGIMAERLTADVALALLANTIATAAALTVLIAGLSPVSGAHFNPAVTLAFLWRREVTRGEAAAYVVAQIVGGIAGTMLAQLMFGLAALDAGTTVRTGGGQWLAEIVAAFALVATILLAQAFRPKDTAWLVGLVIAAAYWFTASTSFANPAVAIARGLTDSFSGIRPVDVPAFIIAELVGAVLAAIAIGWLLGGPGSKQAGKRVSS